MLCCDWLLTLTLLLLALDKVSYYWCLEGVGVGRGATNMAIHNTNAMIMNNEHRVTAVEAGYAALLAGCDVLWGGCPMITLPLERMASRVAASLCYATGLGNEMVVNSQQASLLSPAH